MRPGRVSIMLMTRCGCKRVLTVPNSIAASGFYIVEFIDDAFSSLSRREFMGLPVDKSRRRFEHREEHDKETGLPLYFEEGYYS